MEDVWAVEEDYQARRILRCKYCHCKGLHWQFLDYYCKVTKKMRRGWRLYTPGGHLHECLTLEEWRKMQAPKATLGP